MTRDQANVAIRYMDAAELARADKLYPGPEDDFAYGEIGTSSTFTVVGQPVTCVVLRGELIVSVATAGRRGDAIVVSCGADSSDAYKGHVLEEVGAILAPLARLAREKPIKAEGHLRRLALAPEASGEQPIQEVRRELLAQEAALQQQMAAEAPTKNLD